MRRSEIEKASKSTREICLYTKTKKPLIKIAIEICYRKIGIHEGTPNIFRSINIKAIKVGFARLSDTCIGVSVSVSVKKNIAAAARA